MITRQEYEQMLLNTFTFTNHKQFQPIKSKVLDRLVETQIRKKKEVLELIKTIKEEL